MTKRLVLSACAFLLLIVLIALVLPHTVELASVCALPESADGVRFDMTAPDGRAVTLEGAEGAALLEELRALSLSGRLREDAPPAAGYTLSASRGGEELFSFLLAEEGTQAALAFARADGSHLVVRAAQNAGFARVLALLEAAFGG